MFAKESSEKLIENIQKSKQTTKGEKNILLARGYGFVSFVAGIRNLNGANVTYSTTTRH